MRLHSKTKSKIIIVIIAIIMLCNFAMPKIIFAASTENGGSAIEPISKFLCFIADMTNSLLQRTFTAPNNIKEGEDYCFLYSPGIIFSGTVPAFDINFINPTLKAKGGVVAGKFFVNQISSWREKAKQENNSTYQEYYNKAKTIKDYYSYSGTISEAGGIGDSWAYTETVGKYTIYYKENKKDEVVEIYCEIIEPSTNEKNYYAARYKIDELKATGYYKTYESTAKILQPIIASWYKALRRITLVGLLSVLVYIGIRMVTSSTSQDNAKYKKMFKDWLMAICILFALHYIMSLTIIVIDKINSIIGVSAIGQNGEDVLMTTLRNRIGQAGSWGIAISEVIIYLVITVFSIIYTIQYLRRTIYLAFLTMIAPLITLTYPLDKIKDSKAQAFDMWLKDYIFFSLIQVVHLLLYYVFVSKSLDLANRGYWLYAIVVIGFLTQAEKLIKKMFGFEKSKSLGALSAGATGALVMNAINRLPGGPIGSGSSKSSGGSSSGKGSSNSGVRTASKNPLESLQASANNEEQDSGDEEPHNEDGGNGGDNPPEEGDPSTDPPDDSPNNKQKKRPKRTLFSKDLKNRKSSSQGSTNSGDSGGAGTGDNGSSGTNNGSSTGTKNKRRKSQNKAKTIRGVSRSRRGAAAVYKNYGSPLLRKTFGLGTGFAMGLVGFAAGTSQGDIGKAITGFAAGGAAGYYGGQRFFNATENTIRMVANIKEEIEGVKDVFYKEAEGQEFVQNRQFDRAFRKSPEYLELQKNNKNFADSSIQKMLKAGITDPKKMDKILKNNAKHPRKFSIEKGIAYTVLAEVPDEILINDYKFIKYCRVREIILSPEDVEKLRNNIIEFK